MKLNFTKPFLDLDGEEVKPTDSKGETLKDAAPFMLNKLFAKNLSQDVKGDLLKHMDWARALNAGKEIDCDRSDQEYLKNWIRKHEQLTIIFKSQLLEVFEEKKAELNGVKEKEKVNAD